MKYFVAGIIVLAIGGYIFHSKRPESSPSPTVVNVVAAPHTEIQPAIATNPAPFAEPAPPPPEPEQAAPVDNSPMPTEWTILGKDYHNVKVIEVLPDKVSITYDGGAGSPLLEDLDPDLRKRFSYDPAKAQAAQDAEEATREKVIADEQLASANYAPANVSAPVSSAPAPAAQSQPDPIATAQIQARIKYLQNDIAFMSQEEAKTYDDGHRLKINGDELTKGAYADKIAQEQAEIAQLQSQAH